MDKLRLLIIDDHPIFRAGLMDLLGREPGFEIVGMAESEEPALEMVRSQKPDIILLDIHFPSKAAIEIAQKIHSVYPSGKILTLTNPEEESELLGLIKAGAKGFMQKGATLDELVLAIKTLATGNSYFSKEIAFKFFAMLEKAEPVSTIKLKAKNMAITGRELEILQYIAAEMTNKEIAIKLYISPRTVETHRRNLIQKLQVKNTAGLVRYYLNNFKRSGEKPSMVG